MRGELHFYLRRKDAAKSGRARQLRAKSLCVNEYCSENQQLQTIRVSTEKVIWDATKPLAESNALGATQLVVRISRRDIRMRRYGEIVRKCSPFLLVYTKGENTIDTEEVRKRVEKLRRKRRELGYFSYNAEIETTSRASRTTTEKLTEDQKPFRRHFVENPPLPKKKKLRGSRNKSPEDDIWHGFGDSSEEKEEKSKEKSNDVRVVLLEAEEKKAVRTLLLGNGR
ncbi:hypothetical protein ANCDUO_12994 [Ancylostoma duodenale]|uniref:Uncharacterized protein n=1 Tax=Ancylostoma duodenale TaxID=51022 RepID=A0A0C2GI98_9BILA|nr:hypothetical protein ANCDUO_12994 [Ancylostoma duodenale]